MRLCSACGRELPPEAFQPVKANQGRKDGLSSDCRGCRAERKRGDRRRAAADAGRVYLTREEWKARCREEALQREGARQETRARAAEARAQRPRRSMQDKIRRIGQRQRERRNTDPAYYAVIKARKLARYRVERGARVEAVDRVAVAERDGWVCAICRRKVTRDNWSLDHVTPLSKGGEHTYANVVLAHRRCNSIRGAGRFPVQAPLFAHLDDGVANPPYSLGSSPGDPSYG